MSFAAVLYNAAKSGGLNRKDINWHTLMSAVYREKGAIFDTRPEWRNVLAIRAFTAVNKHIPRGVFDDAIVVAWSTNKGALLSWRGFAANTDPS
jgi:hypothetical protein